MIKDYRSHALFVLVMLAGSSGPKHAHSEPGMTEHHDSENIRRVAIIVDDVSQPREPMKNYRYEDFLPPVPLTEPGDNSARINIQLKSVDGPASSMQPRFKVTNTGDTDLDLAGLALRYWFNCDCEAATTQFQGVIDWAGFMPSGLSITSRLQIAFEPAMSGRQTHVMVVRFVGDSPSLPPGQSVEIHTRFNRNDWGNMPTMNDWSYTSFTSFTEWNKVAGYVDGDHVWGQEP